MFVTVSDFTSALSNLKYYETKLKSEYEKLELLQNQKQIELDALEQMEYSRIKTSLSYEQTINAKGEIVAVLKTRGNGSNASMIDLINKYDAERENIKASYDSMIQKCEYIISDYEMHIQEIKDVLNKLSNDIKEACIEIYVNKKRYIDVACEYYISSSALYRKVNKEIENAISN